MDASWSRRVWSTSDPHRRSPPAAGTQFFKVVLPSTAQKKMLRIPPKFVNKYGSELADVATFTTPSGFKQQIRLKRDKKEIWFHRGWCEFAEHNSIREGYLLVFNYRGNSCFEVLIFDLTTCEIDYPHNYIDDIESDDEMEAEAEAFRASPCMKNEKTRIIDLSDESDASLHTEMERESIVGQTVSERFKKLNRGKVIQCSQHNQLESTKTKNKNEREKSTKLPSNNGDSIESLGVPQEHAEVFWSQKLSYKNRPKHRDAVDKAKMLKLENPSFVVIITPLHLRMSDLYVPVEFVRRFMTRVSNYICFQDPIGRNWRLHVFRNQDYLHLASGWKEIARANNLKTGDICIFELIPQKNTVGLKLYVESLELKSEV